MAAVKDGDTVRLQYKGRLEDGSVFDSSDGGASLEFRVGDGEYLAGLEKGVVGMNVGDSKTIRVPAEEGYGLRQAERIFEWDKSRLPGGFDVAVGQQLQMYRADGMPIMVTVVGVSDTKVTMDCNHPLAGKDLIFDITVEEIV